MRIGHGFAAIALLACSAATASMSAAQTMASLPAPRVVDIPPVAAYRPHLDDTRVTQEIWDYVFWFPTGHRLLAQFQITDAGPGRQTGLVAGLVILPDQTTRLIKNSRARDEWTADVQGADVRLSLVRHRFEIGPSRHHVHVEGRTDRFDVEAERIAPAVLLGPVPYARGEYYDLTVTAPRLRARATVTLDDGRDLALTDGWGVALHAVSTLPDQDQALSVLRVHTFDRPAQFSLLSFAAPPRRGPERVGWVLLFREGGGLEVVPASSRHYAGFEKDSLSPGYTTPRQVTIASAAPSPAEMSVTLALAARFDIISWINTALGRFMARRLFHPIQYVFDASYDMRLGSGQSIATTSGKGVAVMWILNQPKPATWP